MPPFLTLSSYSWLSGITITWGIVMTLMGLVKTSSFSLKRRKKNVLTLSAVIRSLSGHVYALALSKQASFLGWCISVSSSHLHYTAQHHLTMLVVA